MLSPNNAKTVGLVMGAGGILGCAHAGVISVLREAGIPVDVVAGASTGAIFGLGVAAGLDTEYIAAVARQATPWQMFRFYAGRLRASGGNPVARMLGAAGAGKTFADLTMPFAVRATNMHTGVPTTITEGLVLPAIEASIALPFVARPVCFADQHFVDGGFFDTAPVAAARQLGARHVIAVCLGSNYVSPRWLRRRPWTQPVLERWGRQIGPRRSGLRDQLRFGCRMLAESYDPPPPCQDADIAIWPQFGNLSPNSMFGAAFAYEQGERAARAALPAIERLLTGSAS